MKEKKIINCFILIIILMSNMGMSYPKEYSRLKVSIFHIHPYQYIVKNLPSPPVEEGVLSGIQGTKTGGHTTGFFPDGIVLIETGLFQSNEDLIRVIKDKVMFSCPDWVNIVPISETSFHVNTKKLEVSVINEEFFKPPPRYFVRKILLNVQPLSIKNEEAVIKVKVKFSTQLKPTEKKELLDQAFLIKIPRTLLVGFSATDEGKRGAIYWLAISFED